MKKSKGFFRIILSAFAATIMMGAIPACTAESGPKFVAHRGYSHSYVDNTEEAFRAAADMGFYGIETDIRKTKDGYFVCNHDDTAQYADGTRMKISSYDLATLRSKPLANNKTDKDAYICTFETYLRACKSGGKVAVIELKEYFGAEDVQRILSLIDAEYDRKKVTFISFSYLALLEVKSVDRNIPLQYLSQELDDPKFDACIKDRISVDVKQYAQDSKGVWKPLLTEELVKTFHDAGLTVNVWTVDDEADLQKALQTGVDYITTNVFYNE